MGREGGGSGGVLGREDKYEQNVLYETLKELIKIRKQKDKRQM